jgi:hypothetical protein
MKGTSLTSVVVVIIGILPRRCVPVRDTKDKACRSTEVDLRNMAVYESAAADTGGVFGEHRLAVPQGWPSPVTVVIHASLAAALGWTATHSQSAKPATDQRWIRLRSQS